jgi:hypothetical protein
MVKNSGFQLCVFSNMYSLLPINRYDQTDVWPQSYVLPTLATQSSESLSSSNIASGSRIRTRLFSDDISEDSNLTPRVVLKKNSACGHFHRKHYSKNMCSSCYHRSGRAKLSWNWPHTDQPMYSKGMCQVCYAHEYHKLRVARKKAQQRRT